MNKRTREKLLKGSILIYDLKSIPKGMYVEKMIQAFKELGTVFYSSENGGNKPFIIPKRNNKAVIFTNTYKD